MVAESRTSRNSNVQVNWMTCSLHVIVKCNFVLDEYTVLTLRFVAISKVITRLYVDELVVKLIPFLTSRIKQGIT